MRVRSEYRVYPPVEVDAERDFFAGGLGVKIEDGEVVASGFALEYAFDRGERTGERLEIDSAEQVYTQYAQTVDPRDRVAVAGVPNG